MKQNKSALIIGYGEVGNPIVRLLAENGFKMGIIDYETEQEAYGLSDIDVMHICIPYSKKFIEICKDYINDYKPELVVIHSTIPVGTTRKIYKLTKTPIVHSPVRGVHPNLYEGIKTFVKYIGPMNKKSYRLAEKHFGELGFNDMECTEYQFKFMNSPEETELAKILSTTYYGLNITFCKDVKNLCDKHGLDFDNVYTDWNESYNRGYKELGMPNVVRPVLKPMKGEIGGHCVIPNCRMIKDDLEPAYYILKRNKWYKRR